MEPIFDNPDCLLDRKSLLLQPLDWLLIARLYKQYLVMFLVYVNLVIDLRCWSIISAWSSNWIDGLDSCYLAPLYGNFD